MAHELRFIQPNETVSDRETSMGGGGGGGEGRGQGIFSIIV